MAKGEERRRKGRMSEAGNPFKLCKITTNRIYQALIGHEPTFQWDVSAFLTTPNTGWRGGGRGA